MSTDAPGCAEGSPESTATAGQAVLTFQVGLHLFAVQAECVSRILTSVRDLPEGTSVVDAVGLLRGDAAGAEPSCVILLGAAEFHERPVAITASGAGDVRALPQDRLMPIPGFLFRAENPFRGLVPPEPEGAPPLFVLAGPERLLASAGDR